jgi:hypothetical protein
LRGDKAVGVYPTPELETTVDCDLCKCIRSIYGGKLNKKRLMPFTRRRNVVELESIDCFCATLESGALFMVSD